MTGKAPQGLVVLDEIAMMPYFPRDLALMVSLMLRFFLQAVAADLEATRAEVPAMLAIASERKVLSTMAWGNYFGGCAAYLQNDLAAAGEHFRTVVELKYYAHALAYGHGAVGLALTYEAQGRPEEAVAIVNAAEVHFGEAKNATMLAVVRAFAAEIAARQGRMAEARRWLARERSRPDTGLLPLFYLPPLAAVRVLLAAGTGPALAEGSARLDDVTAAAVRLHNVHGQIQCAALAAALHGAAGDRPQAHAALTRALVLAEPGRVVRVFMDLGMYLAPLFADLAVGSAMTVFAARVRNLVEAAYSPATDEPNAEGAAPAAAAVAQAAPSPEADQFLTFREVDVLQLLAQRLTNKEIGRDLGISTDTVKQHTVNLYRKLQVENRRQAIVAGRARGYLNDTAAMERK
jgi:LuxR family maltose regulon positive regulatory protein